MSRFRKSKKQRQERPVSNSHPQQSSGGRLCHWYDHKRCPPFVTVDQLHKYRRKGLGFDQLPLAPPFGQSDSPVAFDTEYRFRFEIPYKTPEEMSVNRRHAAVPKDELQMEGDAEFSAEYSENFKNSPRERQIAERHGSHIGPFTCPDCPSVLTSEQHDQYVAYAEGRRASNARPSTGLRMEGNMELDTELRHNYVPHPDGHPAENLRPSTGLKLEDGTMKVESEQAANYKGYPTTPHPSTEVQPDHNQAVSVVRPKDSCCTYQPMGSLPDNSIKEMIYVRDSGMLLQSARPVSIYSPPRFEHSLPVTLKKPVYRLEVVDCSRDGGGMLKKDATNLSKTFPIALSPVEEAFVVLERPTGSIGTGGNRWVKRRQRKMRTVRFFDEQRPVFAEGKTVQ